MWLDDDIWFPDGNDGFSDWYAGSKHDPFNIDEETSRLLMEFERSIYEGQWDLSNEAVDLFE